MFLFAHIGITLGAAVAASGVIHTLNQAGNRREPKSLAGNSARAVSAKSDTSFSGWITQSTRCMDLRLLVCGSMLPDIIDKPLGMTLLGDGRSIAHTLLVFVLMAVGALLVYLKYRRTGWLAISAGMFSHLILDGMWQTPAVFYWPWQGWGFPDGEKTVYLNIWLNNLLHNPANIVFEMVGLICLVAVVGVLVKQKKLLRLITTGRLPD